MLGLGGKPLIGRLELEHTTHKNTENTGASQAETGSGVCPTNLRILEGSSRMKTTKSPYFIKTS
jgi:hypothetical protein